MAETFYKGENQILYIYDGSSWLPIACLTSNSFDEDVEMLDTTTTDNAGWKTSRPLNQSYRISFEGVQIVTDEITPTRYSYNLLKVFKRNRTQISWKIESDIDTEEGLGYITELSESAPVGELLSFSGTIEGYGKPDATTYYVSNSGSDANSGLTKDDTLANHPFMSTYTGSIVLKPNDTVLMNKGDIWSIASPTDHYLTISVDGEENKMIKTSNYGTGNLPLIKITTASDYAVVYADGKAYFTFEGIAIQHHSKTYNTNENRCGILLDGNTNPCHDVLIKDCEISNIPHEGIRGLVDCYNITIGNPNATTTATETAYSNKIFDFGYAGIGLEGTNPSDLISNNKIIYNYVHDCSRTTSTDAYGIYLSAVLGSTDWPKSCDMSYNNVQNINGWEAIDIHGGEQININNNYIEKFGARGITALESIVGALTPICKTINIKNNTIVQPDTGWIAGNEENFIKVEGVDVVIENNDLSHSTQPTTGLFGGIYLKETENAIVRGNKIYNSATGGKVGISAVDTTETTLIEKNFVNSWSLGAFVSVDAETVNIQNNIFTNIITKGIYMSGGVGATTTINLLNNVILTNTNNYCIYYLSTIQVGGVLNIKNNIIGRTTSGANLQVACGGAVNGTLNCDYNLYWNATANYFQYGGSYINLATWQSNGFDANTPNTVESLDPLFIDAGGSLALDTDYKLQATSPAKGFGVDVGLTDDYFDNLVNTPPDIGVNQT